MKKFSTPESAYHSVLYDIISFGNDDGTGNLEIINYAFSIEDLETIDFKNKVRKFNKDYAQKFLEFIMDGGTDASVLFASNPNAKNFVDDLASRNTAYGPRILQQIPGVVEELTTNRSSRRAVITILNPDDQSLLPEKQKGSKMEYPCTVSLIFLIRDNKLNLHVAMRSNNMTTTVCYDLYNFINIQKILLDKLQKAGLNVELGRYFHVCASAHVLKNEIQFAKDILLEYLQN